MRSGWLGRSSFPSARIELIEGSYTFVLIDQPRRTAELIASFARETAAGPLPRHTPDVAP
jgi:hypothetical protein